MQKRKRQRQIRSYPINVTSAVYKQVLEGTRTFLSACDDRPEAFAMGDILLIQEQKSDNNSRPLITGKSITGIIQLVQKTGLGLMSGYVIIGFKKTEDENGKRGN